MEVNDALVHMLGYGGREELLQTDIRNRVYLSEERYQAFAQKMQQHGGVKNHEETFTRKEKGTGRIRCLLAPQVVSCEHRWWVMLISMSLQLAMIVPLAT